jgi:hypothetical protein
VREHEPLVDRKIAEVRAMTTEIVSSNFARGLQWLQTKAVAVLAQAHQMGASSLKAEPAGEAAPAAGYRSDSFKSAQSGFGPRTYSIGKDE